MNALKLTLLVVVASLLYTASSALRFKKSTDDAKENNKDSAAKSTPELEPEALRWILNAPSRSVSSEETLSSDGASLMLAAAGQQASVASNTVAGASVRECAIEIKTVKNVPGKCTRLGPMGVPACQSDKYVSIDYNSCS